MTENQQGLPGCEHRGGIKWTAPAIAELFDVTDRQVRQWAQESIIPKDRRGEYDLRETVRGVYRHLRKLVERNGADKSLEDLRKEGEELDNEKKRIEIEKLRKELVPADEVWKNTFEKFRVLRDRIENIPSRLSGIINDEQQALLMKEIHDALSGVSSGARE